MEKSTSQEKWESSLKWFEEKGCLYLMISAVVIAGFGIGISLYNGPNEAGFSVVDVCAVLIAFISLCVSARLTLGINRITEQNRIEEKEKSDREKFYAQIHAQAASFPQFKIDTCIVYDLDGLLQKEDDESQKVCNDVRQHEPATQRRYLLKISSQEAFPAYYKVDIKKTHLQLLTDGNPFDIDLTSEHCWVTNNERFTFWINFDDRNDWVKELKEVTNEWIPGEKVCVEVNVEFSCTNVLLEWEKKPPLYSVNIKCSARNEMSNEQVKLEVEHRYLSRMDTYEKPLA